jgi:alkylation response protein AidB-like acyl-CoA dehydrogenase
VDFELTEEQQRLKDEVVRFAREELNDDLVQRDVDSTFPVEAWKKCAAFGIQGLPIPGEYGGSGVDPQTLMVAMEALGYGCRDNGLIFSLNAQMWSCEIPILRSGTSEQRLRYLPRLCDGSIIGVQCMTEPDSGSDAFAMRTTASKTDAGYVLNGAKTFITNGPISDVFVVFAATDPGRGFTGISAFLVDRQTTGVTVGPPFHKMGLRTSPMSEVVFEDCEIPEASRLGPEGAGAAIFNSSMDWERSYILAGAVGSMERQVERCIAYARDRRQFGQSIGKFQAVSHKIVDMKIRLETSRLLLYRLAWQRRVGKPAPMASAMTKVYVSESFVQSSMDALQIHGGYGYLTELELEREVRDAIASRIYSGTSEVQRNVVADHLGLRGR